MRRSLPLVLALLLCAACDGTGLWPRDTLNLNDLEALIETEVEQQFPVDIDRVECPDDVQPRPGDVFVCRAHAVDGSVGIVEVTQGQVSSDTPGGQQPVTFRLTDVLAPEGTPGPGSDGG